MNLYRLLLHLYPSSYRADYGDEMCSDFEQELRLSSGVFAKLGLWLAAIVDVVSNAVAVQWEIARRDISYSLRSLKRSPGFAITALLLITIGIGANAAVFTLDRLRSRTSAAVPAIGAAGEDMGKASWLFSDGTLTGQL